MALFTRMRDGVKHPSDFAGARIIGADMSGCGGKGFRHRAADDDQVFEHDTRRGDVNVERFRVAAETFAQVDPSAVAEFLDRRTRSGIKSDQMFVRSRINPAAPVFVSRPVHQPALVAGACGPFPPLGRHRIMAPHRLARAGIEREHADFRAQDEEQVLGQQRVGLHDEALAAIARLEGPGNFKPVDIARVDLIEGGIFDIVRRSAKSGPSGISL